MKNLKTTTTHWINTSLLFVVGIFMLFLPACDSAKKDDPTPSVDVNKTSIVTPTSFGRTNKKLGCLDIKGRSITISVWDNETVDGDIVSVYVNNRKVIDEVTMGGPSAKTTVDVDLEYAGFNDIKLFAHNLGQYSPNTAAMTITDDAGTKSFTVSSDLATNGYFDLVVSGSGVSCSSAGTGGTGTGGTGTGGTGTGGTGTGGTGTGGTGTGGTGGTGTGGTGTGGTGGTGGGTTITTGDVMFWSAINHNCGSGTITVSIAGRSGSFNQYYPSGSPGCGSSGAANFNLTAGTYTWSAVCGTKRWGPSSVTVTANGCFEMQLN